MFGYLMITSLPFDFKTTRCAINGAGLLRTLLPLPHQARPVDRLKSAVAPSGLPALADCSVASLDSAMPACPKACSGLRERWQQLDS